MNRGILAGRGGGPFQHIWSRERLLEPSALHVGEEVEAYRDLAFRNQDVFVRPLAEILSRRLPQGARVLEIGSGSGALAVALARRNPDWSICAVEASKEAWAQGKALARFFNVDRRIQFNLCDGVRLPFRKPEFDAVYSQFVVHHVPNPTELFKKCYRLIKPGGQVIVRDLLRVPTWQHAMAAWYCRYGLGYSKLQTRLFNRSVAAALTLPEFQASMKGIRWSRLQIRRFRLLECLAQATR